MVDRFIRIACETVYLKTLLKTSLLVKVMRLKTMSSFLIQRIITERDSLQEVNEELRCTQLQTAETQQNSDDMTSPGLEMLSMPPAIK